MSKPEVDSSDIEKILMEFGKEFVLANKAAELSTQARTVSDAERAVEWAKNKAVSQLEAMMVKERIDEVERTATALSVFDYNHETMTGLEKADRIASLKSKLGATMSKDTINTAKQPKNILLTGSENGVQVEVQDKVQVGHLSDSELEELRAKINLELDKRSQDYMKEEYPNGK